MDSDPRLREQDWGEWTGKTIPQLKQEAPLLLAEQEQGRMELLPAGRRRSSCGAGQEPEGDCREHAKNGEEKESSSSPMKG